MASKEVGAPEESEKLWVREFVSDRKGRQFKFYTKLNDAILDEDPLVKLFVYEVNMTLLGKITKVVLPVQGKATKVLLKLGEPYDV